METVATRMHNPAVLETPAPPPGRLLSDHFVAVPGYYGYRAAGTRDWLLTYTQSGKGYFRLAEFVYETQPGDVVLLAPGVPHDYAASSSAHPWDFYWAHFLPRPHWITWLLQISQTRQGFHVTTLNTITTQKRLVQAFERLILDSRIPRAFQEDLALAALEEVLILVAQQATLYAAQPLDPRVELVLQQLARELDAPSSISELAAQVALSPSRLAHLFKQQVGDSIATTQLNLRLHHAARLLAFSSQPINEISRLTGFHSPFHFSRQFKAHYGLSPTDYRARENDI